MWPDARLLELFHIELPIVQAPVAGAGLGAGGGGGGGRRARIAPRVPCSIPIRSATRWRRLQGRTKKPINLNFFCHTPPELNNAREARWRDRLAPYCRSWGSTLPRRSLEQLHGVRRQMCDVVEETKPDVELPLGLPEPKLLERVKARFKVMSSATTAAEARWLEERGVDAVIAQGNEAGGHRGIFLGDDIATQAGTFALVPQAVDAVKVPVIAAGGITDARHRGCLRARSRRRADRHRLSLCPEAKISSPHRAALDGARRRHGADQSMTGRPARGWRRQPRVRDVAHVGPGARVSARGRRTGAAAGQGRGQGSGDFSPMWAGRRRRSAARCPPVN